MVPRYPFCEVCHVLDRVQTKTLPFSTRHIILLNYKVVSQLSQLSFLSLSYLNSAQHNLAVELCRAPKIYLFLHLFSKSIYSFVAIELLVFFSQMQNSIFIAQESSRYLGFKINTHYIKRIGFFSFCVYKNVSQKKAFCI